MHNAFFLEANSGKQLFATSCIPDTPGSTGILICPPFGGERQRVYRSTYLFACALAKHQVPSLRFDYIGIGDSDGDLPDVSMESILDDTLLVAQKAKDILGVDNLIILGIRFGAIPAALAASRLDWIDTCILWNPVVSGKAYLKELRREEKIIHLTGKKNRDPVKKDLSGQFEFEADFMSPLMQEQMAATDLAAEALDVETLFVAGIGEDRRERASIEEFVAVQNDKVASIETWLEQPREYWSATAMYDAYFPNPTFDVTVDWINKHVGNV